MSATFKRMATIDECLDLQRNIRLRGIGNPFIARCGKRWNLFEMIERRNEDGSASFTMEPRKMRTTVERLYAHLEAVAMPEHRRPMPVES
jgi:hypothetical protein